jgi:hypothetical protein
MIGSPSSACVSSGPVHRSIPLHTEVDDMLGFVAYRQTSLPLTFGRDQTHSRQRSHSLPFFFAVLDGTLPAHLASLALFAPGLDFGATTPFLGQRRSSSCLFQLVFPSAVLRMRAVQRRDDAVPLYALTGRGKFVGGGVGHGDWDG